MHVYTHLAAPHDVYGNPRRLFLVYEILQSNANVVAIIQEGYRGDSVHEYFPGAVKLSCHSVTIKEYKTWVKLSLIMPKITELCSNKLRGKNMQMYSMEKDGKKVVLKVVHYDYPESPRDWDNLGTMVCWHRRYNLGDTHQYEDTLHMLTQLANYTPAAPMGGVEHWEKERIRALFERYYIILPVYMYDHSGVSLSTSGYGDRWDSGQVGWIYVSKEDVRKKYNVKRITKKIRLLVESVLKAEVEVYSQYVSGDVYGYTLYVDDEEIDSCWGFYGYNPQENGIADNLPNEYKEVLNLPKQENQGRMEAGS